MIDNRTPMEKVKDLLTQREATDILTDEFTADGKKRKLINTESDSASDFIGALMEIIVEIIANS